MDLNDPHPVTVAPLGPDHRVWQDFLGQSTNGTLFHDLEFLHYHPSDRFHFHHLVFMRDGKPIALLPGGFAGAGEKPTFCSPVGASIGGFAVADPSASLMLAIVKALQDYARTQAWQGIEVTLPPAYYSFKTAELISFALFCGGFRLQHRWLSHVIELDHGPDMFVRQYRSRQISPVRAARRKGMRSVEAGIEGWADFVSPFRDTYERHGVPATHTEDEIRDLLMRLPDRVSIHAALLADIPVASLLVFKLTKTIANSFYICSSAEYASENGAAFLIADTMDRLASAGFRFLDLGPSASDMKFNTGVTFFKEGLGATGQCRDRWHWQAEP